jgi:hypothetical protein
MNTTQLNTLKLLIRDGSYGFLGEGPTLTERTALYQAVTKLEADARALWAVRVLDAAAYHLARLCYTRFSAGYGWRTEYEHNHVPVAGHDFSATPDAARIAAAEALVAEDPALGEGL